MDWDGNFQYKGLIDIAALKARVSQQSDADWEQDAHRQTTFPPHRFTQTIPLLYDADFRHENPTAQSKFAAFETDLRPVFEFLAHTYGRDGVSVRCILTRLAPGDRISAEVSRMGPEIARSLFLPPPTETRGSTRIWGMPSAELLHSASER